MKKKRILMVIIPLIAILAIFAWYFYNSRGRVPALAFGGEKLHIRLVDRFSYQQDDPMWKDKFLANNPAARTLAKTGCTISSVAVALSNLGVLIKPPELNDALSQNGGFTSRGWLIWDAIEKATNGKAKAYAYSTPERSDIDLCLKNNQYPIVKYLIGGVVQHWVTVVGKEDGTYLIRDPLIASDEPEALHRHTPVILSVRCIGLTENGKTSQKSQSHTIQTLEKLLQ